jgi:hypothetical protein
VDIFIDVVQRFGLPIAILLACVYYLAKTIQIILKGDLAVPRWLYDEERADHAETKAALREATRGIVDASRTTGTAVDAVVKKV